MTEVASPHPTPYGERMLRHLVPWFSLAALITACEPSNSKDVGTPSGGSGADTRGGLDPGLIPCTDDAQCPGAVLGDRCVARQACQSGRCVAVPAVDCSAALTGGVPCRAPVCVPATGACLVGAAPDGSACVVAGCNNAAGVCSGGECRPGAGAECDDGDACTVDACVNQACTHAHAADGTACPSEDACVEGKVCTAGVCGGGYPKVCNDDNECTTDACHPPGGCVFTFVPASPKRPCEDDNPCMGPDYCNGGGHCQSEWYKNAEGKTCDVGDACALHATCQDGLCRAKALEGGGVDALPDGSKCAYTQSNNGCFADTGSCLSGACQPIPVPDGAECPHCWCPGCIASPGPGHCYAGTCECQ